LLFRDRPIIKKVEKKKSVVLQCAVQGQQVIFFRSFNEHVVKISCIQIFSIKIFREFIFMSGENSVNII
jgi:hypothetical protein